MAWNVVFWVGTRRFARPDVDSGSERLAATAQQVRGQLTSYAAGILGSQFRLHVFSISIFGEFARFMRWDRSGVIVSEPFNFTRTTYLDDFLSHYSCLGSRYPGHDLTVKPINIKELEETLDVEQRNKLKEGMTTLEENASRPLSEFRQIEIPSDRDNTDVSHRFLISYPPHYTTRSPFGRATRGMLGYDIRKHPIVYIKDYWRDISEGIEREGEIYRTLKEKKVR